MTVPTATKKRKRVWVNGISVATPEILGFVDAILENPGCDLHRHALADYLEDNWGERGLHFATGLRRPGVYHIKRLSVGKPVQLYWDVGGNRYYMIAEIQKKRYPKCALCGKQLRPLRVPPMFVARGEMMVGVAESGWHCFPNC